MSDLGVTFKPSESFEYKFMVNTVINSFQDFIEIIYYKQPFTITEGEKKFQYLDMKTGELLKTISSRKRLLEENEDGVLIPSSDSVTIESIKNSLKESRRRYLDNFYGYALSNDWDYFITFTIAEKQANGMFINRNNDDVMKLLWSKFQNKIKHRFRDIKILCNPERHPKSGCLHFHAIFGNCDLSKFITPAVDSSEFLWEWKNGEKVFKKDESGNKIPNPKFGKPIKSKFGEQVYNLSCWNFGFSTCVKLPRKNNKLRVVNYLIKYVSKSNNMGRFQNRYYRTHNLNFKNKLITKMEEDEFNKNINSMFAVEYKNNKKMKVYRIYENQFDFKSAQKEAEELKETQKRNQFYLSSNYKDKFKITKG